VIFLVWADDSIREVVVNLAYRPRLSESRVSYSERDEGFLDMHAKKSMLIVIALVSLAVTFGFVEPIPQWPEYHDFADGRTLFGIVNAHNVLSNLGLIIVGAWGLLFMSGESGKRAVRDLWLPYMIYFSGLILTGLGSAYYHHEPGSETLIWDRLPMTIMFMGLFSTIVGEVISSRTGNKLLAPLLLIGVASVLWWAWTESIGAGDLRMYALVQFLPPVLVVFMLFAYPRPLHYVPYIVATLGFYVVAKLCEEFDVQVYQALHVSGHALKHLVSALASGCILLMLYRRRGLHESGTSTTGSGVA
jgi:hypothetical protein